MSTLPEIPSNLLTNRESIQNVGSQQVGAATTAALGQADAAADAALGQAKASVDAAKQKVLEEIFPESIFTNIALDVLEFEINKKISKYNLAVTLLLRLPATRNFAQTLVSPAEIREYIDNKIDKIKRKKQEAIIIAQSYRAKAEETPFTARLNKENNTI